MKTHALRNNLCCRHQGRTVCHFRVDKCMQANKKMCASSDYSFEYISIHSEFCMVAPYLVCQNWHCFFSTRMVSLCDQASALWSCLHICVYYARGMRYPSLQRGIHARDTERKIKGKAVHNFWRDIIFCYSFFLSFSLSRERWYIFLIFLFSS